MKAHLEGQRFGRLTVLQKAEARNGKQRWLCMCDCGGRNTVATGSLRSGHIQSCGCLYVESRGTRRTHGKSKLPEYRVWKSMITRCENRTRDFWKRYGGRGIYVCDRWRNDFTAFLRDMGPRPSSGHTIERINNDGNYEPDNCRWATYEEQGQNTSRARRITFDGQTMSIGGWARRLRMSRTTITNRLESGDPIHEVLRPSTNGGYRPRRR